MIQNLAPMQARITAIVQNNIKTFQELAQCSGVLYKYKQDEVESIDHLPCTVFPKIVDYKFVLDLKVKQRILQTLINNMSRQFQWYKNILQKISTTNDFVKNMLDIQEKVEQCETASKINFCIVRNDVMHHALNDTWYQIEYNCMAISSENSDNVQRYHQMLLNSHFKDIAKELKIHVQQDLNDPLMMDAFQSAFLAYNSPKGIILTIVLEFEGNIFDQRILELELAKRGIVTVRSTFKQLRDLLTLDENDGKLTYCNQEVAIVYFRAGYSEEHYENEEDWKVREKIELSRAIKCPSLNIQLINFKKLQEVFQDKQEMEKFITLDELELLSQNFCKFWGFDDIAKQNEKLCKIMTMIQNNPGKFVLKPQKEGGGHNYFDDEILMQLNNVAPEQRYEYTLMEKIESQPEVSYRMVRGRLELAESVSEIGIMGYFLSENNIIKNEVGGYYVRTKKASSNEGGVSTGDAVVDSLAIKDS